MHLKLLRYYVNLLNEKQQIPNSQSDAWLTLVTIFLELSLGSVTFIEI